MVSPRLFACRAISRTDVDSQTDPRSGWPIAKSRWEPLPPADNDPAGETASVRGSTSVREIALQAKSLGETIAAIAEQGAERPPVRRGA